MTDPTSRTATRYPGGRVEDHPVLITLRGDSFTCPTCDVIVVATCDRTIDLVSDHVCREGAVVAP